MRNSLLALIAATILLSGTALTVSADNWGAGAGENGTGVRCTVWPDIASECTPNDRSHAVWFNPFMLPSLRTDLELSMEDDWDDPISLLTMTTITDIDADVQIAYADLATSMGKAFTTCSTTADTGGSGYNKWCRPQLMYFNSDYENTTWANPAKRRTLSCHELGHTLGLVHAKSWNHPNPALTCMSYQDAPDPRQHDRNHIVNCFPHPSGPARPPDCVEND